MAALADDWDVEVVSWVPDIEEFEAGRRHRPIVLLKALLLSIGRPFQVSYMQACMPRPVRRHLAASRDEVTVYVTNRAAPRVLPARAIVDFVDDLGGAARRRAEAAPDPGRRLFWTVESRRTCALDRRLAQQAAVSVAISAVDGANIAPTVRAIPNSIRTPPLPVGGDKVVFAGNLFFEPNHEAAVWICSALVPYLASVGVAPHRVVLAGRRPQPSLHGYAEKAGVDFRPDLPDLAPVLGEAAVVIAPMTLGSGIQTKVLEAVGAGRPCVVSPKANSGLGLVDGQSALVRDCDPKPFGDAIVSLLGDPAQCRRLVEEARAQLTAFTEAEVASGWRGAVADCADAGAQERATSR